MFERNVQALIAAVAERVGELEVAERRIGSRAIEKRLVGIIDGVDVGGFAADVIGLEKQA